MHINKQTTTKAGFNPNSIKDFINIKTTFKNIFQNLKHIDFTIFCLQMSIQIGNVSKQEKIYINKQIIIIVGTRSLGHRMPWTSSTIINRNITYYNVFLYTINKYGIILYYYVVWYTILH